MLLKNGVPKGYTYFSGVPPSPSESVSQSHRVGLHLTLVDTPTPAQRKLAHPKLINLCPPVYGMIVTQ